MNNINDNILIKWAMELQSLAQIGLTYTKDLYDRERFIRIREISAEMMSIKSGLSFEIVQNLFCNETGYQTPKVDTRAAIFNNDEILLVKEKDKWSLPGGWADINESIKSNTIKEVKEEAGLDVAPTKLIAVQDRNKHNNPQYAYSIYKIFVLCELLSGDFKPNIETEDSSFFNMSNLPILDTDKTTKEQINMCFDAYRNENWVVQFD